MAYDFTPAYDNDLITVDNADESRGIFHVRVGTLNPTVEIVLGREIDNDRTHFTQSHAMKAPNQATPYRTSRPFSEDPVSALGFAFRTLTDWYHGGVKAGHTPSDDWLVDY